jgi:hypothetical protein
MRNINFYRTLFLAASVYDLFLGLVFFLFYKAIYFLFGIQLPENPAYLHLATAFVFVQGISYYYVFRNLRQNIDMVRVGIFYKIIYAGVSFYYWIVGGLPHPIFAVFGICDLIFGVLFVLYLIDYKRVIR